jgi:hypothetical protein
VAVIKIPTFGGMAPSANPKLLPDNGAVLARDLTLRFGDFRPLLQNATVVASTGTTNPLTIYRFQKLLGGGFNTDPTSGWVVNAVDANYVRSLVASDTDERTYYTQQYDVPKATSLSLGGASRPLGVPYPSSAPGASVNVIDEYTTAERTADITFFKDGLWGAMDNAVVRTWFGASSLGGLTLRTTANGYSENVEFQAVTTFTGVSDGAGGRKLSDAVKYGWALDPRCDSFWNAAGNLAVPITVYGYKWVLPTSFKTTIAGWTRPSDGAVLLTSGQVDDLYNTLVDHFAEDSYTAQRKTLFDTFVTNFVSTTALTLQTAQISAMSDFFARSDVSAALSAAQTEFANSIYALADALHNANDGNPGTAGTDTSTIWDATKATATSGIISQLASYIGTGADGSITLNTTSLQSWLDAQFELVCAQGVQPAYATSSHYPVLKQYIAGAVSKLAQFFTTTYWQNTSTYFPTTAAANAVVDSGETIINAVRKLQLDAINNSHELIYYAEDKIKQAKEVIATWFDANITPDYPAGVERIVESRAYIATYVTDWDEESAPSDASAVVDVDQNDTVTVTVPSAPSGYNINRYRLYRSLTGSSTSAFQFVVERTIASGYSYTDSLSAAALGESCPTTTWYPPAANDGNLHPDGTRLTNLQGLTAGPNGVMAAFFDQTACFCEPYVPYAWPREYEIPLSFPVVGVGVFGQTFVFLTRANPYFISGTDSASMSSVMSPVNQACVAKRSIANVPGGVIYASPDGLCMADASGVNLISTSLFNRADWQAMGPQNLCGIEHEGVYYGFWSGGSQALMFDIESKQMSVVQFPGSAAYVDRVNDIMYVADGTTIKAVYGSASKRTALWRSKIFRLDRPMPMCWLMVDADFDGSTSVTVRIYTDESGTAWHTATVTTDEPVRLPPGVYRDWQIEVESTLRLSTITIASSTDELKAA